MKTSSKALACSGLLVTFVVSLLVTMSVFRFQTTLGQLIQGRISVVSENIADSVEGAIDLGLSLGELRNADVLLLRAQASDPEITGIDIFAPGGKILFSTAPDQTGNFVDPGIVATQKNRGDSTWGVETVSEFISGASLTDSIGRAVGGVALTYSKRGFHKKVRSLGKALLTGAALVTAAFIGLVYFGIRLSFRSIDRSAETSPIVARAGENRGQVMEARKTSGKGILHRLTQRLLVLLVTAMVLSSVAVAGLVMKNFDRLLAPELEAKAQMIGSMVEADLMRALELGIPFGQIYGAERYLEDVVSDHVELVYIAINSADSPVIYQGGHVSGETRNSMATLPASPGPGGSPDVKELDDALDYTIAFHSVDGTLGRIHVGVDKHYAQQQLDDIFFNIVVILIAAILVAFEVMLVLVQTIRARAGLAIRDSGTERLAAVSDVRIPLFLFAFAEELQKSFLPLFVQELYTPVPWLNEPVIIGLPIAVYLAVLAIAAPYSGRWAERYGSRKLFLLGLLPAIAGFIGCSLAGSISELVLWRGTTALGYAMITVSCQDYIIANSHTRKWGRNMVLFVGIIMSATMCGTAVGGILADRFGYQTVFALAAVIAVLAGMAASRSLVDSPGIEPSANTSTHEQNRIPLKHSVSAALRVASNLHFVLFLLCIAIPANVLVAAYLWYLVPLYLSDLGATASEIARVMMLYYLLIVLFGPAASRMADLAGSRAWLIGLGSLLSGIGLVTLNEWESIWAVVISVTVLGLTHALTKGAQVPLALFICAREAEKVGRTTILGFLRFSERIGSLLGLMVSAMLIANYGYQASIGLTGILVSSTAFLFLIVHLQAVRQVEKASPGETS